MNRTDRAAQATLAAVNGGIELPFPVEDPEGKSLAHATWMLDLVASREISGDKAQRWLGYAQGLLVMHGKATLGQLKEVNRHVAQEEMKEATSRGH